MCVCGLFSGVFGTAPGACMQAVQGAIQAMEAELGELRLLVKDVTLRSFSEDSSRRSSLSEVRKRAGWNGSTHGTDEILSCLILSYPILSSFHGLDLSGKLYS